MKTRGIILYIVFLLTIGFFSCKEIETFSEIPEIKYKSFTTSDYLVYDTLGNPCVEGFLTFEFQDGDGDFGHNCTPDKKDTTNNLYIRQLEKRDGIYYNSDVADSNRQDYKRKICYDDVMKRDGQNKLLKGEIEINFMYTKFYKNIDTMKYSFYIKDRANHQSNVEYSEEIVIDWDRYGF